MGRGSVLYHVLSFAESQGGCIFTHEVVGISSRSWAERYLRQYFEVHKLEPHVAVYCLPGADWKRHPLISAVDQVVKENCGRWMTLEEVWDAAWAKLRRRPSTKPKHYLLYVILKALGAIDEREDCIVVDGDTVCFAKKKKGKYRIRC